ncbi:hypothetical protein GWI33_018665 [Rhynchophorus ferrugineus]|uniref:Uncharacterized protein n=1 Tax=Rhynchophorus ferrugineus TaxID=354439 RepID=A0A834HTC2_RHYFE|nr:hypothetical protein GWI33_018665 [Rhynchophorus ferrugineus]
MENKHVTRLCGGVARPPIKSDVFQFYFAVPAGQCFFLMFASGPGGDFSLRHPPAAKGAEIYVGSVGPGTLSASSRTKPIRMVDGEDGSENFIYRTRKEVDWGTVEIVFVARKRF